MVGYSCKMCGGTLDITEGMSVCECQYCGSKQTLPKLSDEKKNNLYDRASHFRRNNEYDKAMSIYEQILNEDTEDAESYWSLVLCTYGIEYVEDPLTKKRVPTINRAQMTSIYADENYKSALKYADSMQKLLYEEEAKEIEQILKGIFAISSKEEPFDVFICYKESDANGRRTPDSVLANELYHQLTQEGFKVFFARITLEDKLGSAYEPYIFAALNSAKVMVVLGTKPEYFNAVWVRNEWSRYLALIKKGENKILIPAYRDMDPYDLPEEMAYLQALDMSKLGFMQDLIRGIKKITGQENKSVVHQVNTTSQSKNETAAIQQGAVSSTGAQALVERAFLFLEDGEFDRADELCEKVLNLEPKNAKAYVGKLLVEKKLRTQEALSEGTEALTENNYFQKAIRFAEDSLKNELNRCNQMIMDRSVYERAVVSIPASITNDGLLDDKLYSDIVQRLKDAVVSLQRIPHWEDSVQKLEECNNWLEKLPNLKKQAVYQRASSLILEDSLKIDALDNDLYKKTVQKIEQAISGFNSIIDWEDSRQQIEHCKEQLQQLSKQKEQSVLQKLDEVCAQAKEDKNLSKAIETLNSAVKLYAVETSEQIGNRLEEVKKLVETLKNKQVKQSKKKRRRLICVACIMVLLALVFVFIIQPIIIFSVQYFTKGEAVSFDSASPNRPDNTYKEKAKIKLDWYNDALDSAANNNRWIIGIGDYFPDIYEWIDGQTVEWLYDDAKELYEKEEYIKALYYFGVVGDEYLLMGDTDHKIRKLSYEYYDKCREEIYTEAKKYMEQDKYETAMNCFTNLPGYKDSDSLYEICLEEIREAEIAFLYEEALKNYDYYGDYEEAIEIFEKLGDYRDSEKLLEQCRIKDMFPYELIEQDKIMIFGLNSKYADIEECIVPESMDGYPVISIGEYAFYNCSSLMNIEIPDSVTSIGKYAFAGCSSLTNIEIPDSVTLIGEAAFADCNSLTNIEIPDGVTSIDKYAFSYCSNLTNIKIPDGVTSIGNSAFSGCNSLTNIEIPDSVTSIGGAAFMYCNSLNYITVSKGSYAEAWALSEGYNVQYK